MPYRTRTYIAADWTGDKEVVDQLRKWNDSNYWGLSFIDAHDLTSARDTSLPCTIKESLRERLSRSKTFVLIVGDQTSSLTKGGCRYCSDYSSYFGSCNRGHKVDYRSYIQYECEYAARNIPKVVVIYNRASVSRPMCSEAVRYEGEHVPAYYWENGKLYWNYQGIKAAIEG